MPAMPHAGGVSCPRRNDRGARCGGCPGAATINPPPGRCGSWRDGQWRRDASAPCPEEAAVAIVIDGSSQAVLMATPHDLHDFALGFALTEGLIADPADVTGFEIAPVPSLAALQSVPAHEARLWLKPGLSVALAERRRMMVGPVGCGLCGVDSIAAALPAVRRVATTRRFSPAQVLDAMDALAHGQVRRRDTPAIHGACLWTPDRALVREDVGRHNALDKLAGAAARAGCDAAAGHRRDDLAPVRRSGAEDRPAGLRRSGGRRRANRSGRGLGGWRRHHADRACARHIFRSLHPSRPYRTPRMTDKLIRMATQIADFFRSQPGVVPEQAVAGHINDFWTYRMRMDFLSLLNPARLSIPSSPPPPPCSPA